MSAFRAHRARSGVFKPESAGIAIGVSRSSRDLTGKLAHFGCGQSDAIVADALLDQFQIECRCSCPVAALLASVWHRRHGHTQEQDALHIRRRQTMSTLPTAAQQSLERQGAAERSGWGRSLTEAIRDADRLADRLGLDDEWRTQARRAAELFPIMVTESFLKRIQPGDPNDPLLRQVLPVDAEFDSVEGFESDALHESEYTPAPGVLHKYEGRALLVLTGSCAIHCRYCFRRHFPYDSGPQTRSEWSPTLDWLRNQSDIREVLLSGGDPLMKTDAVLFDLIDELEQIPHLKRLRLHTRLPIVLPDRITPELPQRLTSSRLQPIIVVHANHPNEVVDDCADSLRILVRSGIPVLNQAVLLREVNDDRETQFHLCERLIDIGVMPYYLHQLDRVTGTAHFSVPDSIGHDIIESLRSRLPGYAVPRFVREIPGQLSKRPVESARVL